MTNTTLFKNTESALFFAFNYSHDQYGLSVLAKMCCADTGSGKGLNGNDGAAQAAMILNKLDRLPKEQRWVLTVRFASEAKKTCPCCNQLAPTDEWTDALDELARSCVELEGIPQAMRHAMIKKVLCREKADLKGLSERYGLVLRTTYRQQKALQERLNRIEESALDSIRIDLAELLETPII